MAGFCYLLLFFQPNLYQLLELAASTGYHQKVSSAALRSSGGKTHGDTGSVTSVGSRCLFLPFTGEEQITDLSTACDGFAAGRGCYFPLP